MARIMVALCFIIIQNAAFLFGAQLTVSSDGGADFSSIQEAINEASPGDTITITDTAIYREQVTIGPEKNGITLRSVEPEAKNKPVVLYHDTLNIGPTTCEEGKKPETVTFKKNGALRILGARNVTVEGIAIDAGGIFPFGAERVWPDPSYGVCRWDLQSGNAALCLYSAREAVIRFCSMANGYYGVFTTGYNPEGIWAPGSFSPDDSLIPYSKILETGNHLIAYSQIHHNSFGFYFESVYDLGAVIHNNLIYENRHPDSATALLVKNLTMDGSNQPGGAFMFKDNAVSPCAVYHNTFRHNAYFFLANEKCGAVHHVFNNIFGQRHVPIGEDPFTGNNWWQDMVALLPERLHHSVIASQYGNIQIIATSSGGIARNEGDPVSGLFPAANEVRRLEEHFLATDSSDVNFLVPDWEDTIVLAYVTDKGWPAAGIKDVDGTPSDLGAIAKDRAYPDEVILLRPNTPLRSEDSMLTVDFSLIARNGSIENPKITFCALVKDVDGEGEFGSSARQIGAEDIIPLEVSDGKFDNLTGTFRIEVPITSPIGDFAFVDIIVSGTGSGGTPVSAVGTIPYRKMDNTFSVRLFHPETDSELTSAAVEDTVLVRVKALSLGELDSSEIDTICIRLQSGNPLNDTARCIYSGPFMGETVIPIVFSEVPSNNREYVFVSGKRADSTLVYGYLGWSKPVTVSEKPAFNTHMRNSRVRSGMNTILAVDLQGRVVRKEKLFQAGGAGSRKNSIGVYMLIEKDCTTGKTAFHRRLLMKR